MLNVHRVRTRCEELEGKMHLSIHSLIPFHTAVRCTLDANDDPLVIFYYNILNMTNYTILLTL